MQTIRIEYSFLKSKYNALQKLKKVAIKEIKLK